MSRSAGGRDDGYTIREHTGERAFHELRDEWERLWPLSTEATENQTWEWQSLYWKHLAPNGTPYVVTCRDGAGGCVALASFLIVRDQRSSLRKAGFLGDKLPDYHHIVAAPGVPETVGARMLDAMARRLGRQASFVELTNVPATSWTGRCLQRFAADGRFRGSLVRRWETETFAVCLPATIEAYLKELGRGSKANSRRRRLDYERRRLSKEFSVELRVYTRPERLEEGLRSIEEIDRARWGNDSRFAVGSARAFHHAIARSLCVAGMYRAFVLHLDGLPRAYVSGPLLRNSFVVPHLAFDPSVPGKFSVGWITNLYAIEHCIEQGYREYDLSRGSEAYKEWLGAKPRTNLHVRIFRSRLDQWLERCGKGIASLMRRQTWLRRGYQRFLRK